MDVSTPHPRTSHILFPLSDFFPGEVLVAYQYSLDSDGLGFSKENSIIFSLGFFDPRTSLDCFHTNATWQPRVCWEPNWPIYPALLFLRHLRYAKDEVGFLPLSHIPSQDSTLLRSGPACCVGTGQFFPYPETL